MGRLMTRLSDLVELKGDRSVSAELDDVLGRSRAVIEEESSPLPVERRSVSGRHRSKTPIS